MKRLLAMLLCLAMCLTACGEEKGEGTAAPMGRYVQTDITPAAARGTPLRNLQVWEDGTLACFTGGTKPVLHTSGDAGASWRETPLICPEETDPEYGAFVALPGGGVWMAGPDEKEGALRLYETDTENAREIEVPAFTEAAQREETLTPMVLTAQDDTVVITALVKRQQETQEGMNARAYVFSAGSGAMKRVFDVELHTSGALHGETLTVFTPEGERVDYALTDGRETLRERVNDSPYMAVGTVDEEGAACLFLQTGIRRVLPEGSIPEVLCADTAFAYADSACSVRFAVALPDGGFCAAYVGENGGLFRYDFSVETPAKGENAISVWALNASQTLKAAVTRFRQNNPETDVVLELGHPEGEEISVSDDDLVRSLNARLVAGDGPDVIILDGLDGWKMAEKGFLTDLTGLVEEADYFESFLHAWRRDGRTWAYPARVELLVLAGDTGLEAPMDTWGALSEGVRECPDLSGIQDSYNLPREEQPLLFFDNWNDMLAAFYPAAQPALFPGGISLDRDALREWLAATKEIVDHYGLTEEPNGKVQGAVLSVDMGPAYELPLSGQAYSYGSARACAGPALGLADTPLRAVGVESICPLPGNAFVPVVNAAVTAGSQNPEAAKEFVRLLLSDDVQKEQPYPEGFAVKREAVFSRLKTLAERREQTRKERPDAVFSDLKHWDAEAFLEEFTVPSYQNDQLKEKIYAEATKLYSGEATLEQAVAAAADATRLYFAEQN